MPLLDHFQPPLSVVRPWEAVHNTWATTLAGMLNRELPPDYYAIPLTTVRGGIEIDVAANREPLAPERNGAVATAVWAPAAPPLQAGLDVTRIETFEVRLLQNLGGPQLRAAVELVSPSNKDRPAHRRAFAAKCAAYLQQGVSVVVLDVVTERTANLHAELVTLLHPSGDLTWHSPTDLYAVAYRTLLGAVGMDVQVWPETLSLGQSLPVLPLWLDVDLCLPLPLEESYRATCDSLRIPWPDEDA